MFQVGTHDLVSGALTGTATFPAAFAAIPSPPLVVPVVENFSADDPKLLIHAHVMDVTETGFEYELTGAPDTANYKLVYLAGSPEVLFAAITSMGRRVTQLPVFSGTPADTDRVGSLTRMSPIPQSYAWTVGAIKSLFAGRLAAVPAAPTSNLGDPLSFAIDANYLYVKLDTGAARIGLSTASWAISDAARKRETGSLACTSGQSVQTITFAGEFPVAPTLRFSIRNTAAGGKLMLHGMVTGRTTTTAEITLNADPDSADYYIDYEASSPQA